MAAAILTDFATIRAQLPVTNTVTYLNTGVCAPLPTVAAQPMIHDINRDLDVGSADTAGYEMVMQHLAYLRSQLAAVIGATPADIAVTPSTRSGIDVVMSGRDWQPGDRIVTTTAEHPAALAPLYRAHRRYGVDVVFADVGNGESGRVLDMITAALAHPGTKLLVVSHVTYNTGALLPVNEIIRVAHESGVEVLVDGAQAVGSVPVGVIASGADYLVFPGRKWLFGPDGTGALYVHRAKHGDLYPCELDVFSLDVDAFRDADAWSKLMLPGAARFDQYCGHLSVVAGWSASLDWLGSIGWPQVHAATATCTDHALACAAELPGSRVLTPSGARAGIVAFTVDGVDSVACVEFLAQNAVAVRSIPGNGAIRMSCGFFVTVDEIDRAFSLIDTFRRSRSS